MTDRNEEFAISDELWALLEPHLPGQTGSWGGVAQDNRRFIDGVFWVLRTGSPWRALPPEYGKWGTAHQRFIRWRKSGVWEQVLALVIDRPDCQWLVLDSRCIKAKHRDGRCAFPWMRMIFHTEVLQDKLSAQLLNCLSP